MEDGMRVITRGTRPTNADRRHGRINGSRAVWPGGGKNYRLFFLNSIGHIGWGEDQVCADDQEAMGRAEVELAERDCLKVEVWSGDTRIGIVLNDRSTAQRERRFSASDNISLIRRTRSRSS
jgi:hypothetical protein